MKNLSDFNAKRTLFLFDNFDQYTSKILIKDMLDLDAKSNEEINIMINSWGGEVYSLFAILDTIKSIKSPVNTICLGEADSCGAVLLSAGKERYIGKNSRTMIHEVSTFTWGKVSEIEENLKDAKEINDKLISILASNSSESFDNLKEIMKKDTFLDAEASKNMGLVDFVLEEPEQTFKDQFSGVQIDKLIANNYYTGAIRIQNKRPAMSATHTQKNKKKGEEIMDKKELMASLKNDFNLDVEMLITAAARVPELEESVKASLEAKVAAEKELADTKKDQEQKNIDALLDSLITDLKASQETNKVNRIAFEAVGYEAAKAIAETMPVIAKMEQKSSSTNEVEDATMTDAEKEDAEIKAYMTEKNVDYSTALSNIMENKKKGVN